MLYAAAVLAAPGGVAVPPRLLAAGVGGVQRVFCRGHLVADGIETGARWLAITSRPPSSPARLGDPPRWRAPSGRLFDEAMFAPTGGRAPSRRSAPHPPPPVANHRHLAHLSQPLARRYAC